MSSRRWIERSTSNLPANKKATHFDGCVAFGIFSGLYYLRMINNSYEGLMGICDYLIENLELNTTICYWYNNE